MTYRPALAANDADLIHCSTRTFLSTNARPGGNSAKVTLRVTRLDLRWEDGDVVARFSAQETDVLPTRRMIRPRDRR